MYLLKLHFSELLLQYAAAIKLAPPLPTSKKKVCGHNAVSSYRIVQDEIAGMFNFALWHEQGQVCTSTSLLASM
jgi:hypothetical protein